MKVMVDRSEAPAIAAAAIAIVRHRPARQKLQAAWQRHPYQVRPAGDWMIWCLEGGRGCIAAGTMIYDPLTGTETAVEELARCGESITVQALTESGPRACAATAPFVKGYAPLYRVRTDAGNVIVVTDQHRFLTPSGWRPCGQLGVGHLLASPRSLLASILGYAPSASPQGDHDYTRTRGDSSARCCASPHRCDRRLLPDRDSDRGRAPSPAGAHAHNRPSCGEDGPETSRGYSRPHPVCVHRSRTRCAPFELSPADAGYRDEPCAGARTLRSNRGSGPSLDMSGRPPQVAAVDPRRSASVALADADSSNPSGYESERPSPALAARSSEVIHRAASRSIQRTLPRDTPQPRRQRRASSYLDYTAWERIAAIERVGFGAYYDLTVPGPANYLANGLYHHNSGKTRTGAEEVLYHIEHEHGGRGCHVGVGAPTNDDVRKVCFEEESGLMGSKVAAADRFRKYNRQGLEAWHQNGALISGVGSEEPGRWNGRNFCFVWWDEGSLCNPESLTQSLLALRKKYMDDAGQEQQPRMLITTTPKPSKHIREWKTQPTTVVTRGTTYDNMDNLSQATVMELKRRYEGTTLGRRELLGEDIDDIEGALWKRAWIDDHRVRNAPGLARVVVAIDPAVTHGADSDETGIAVAGLGDDGDIYVLHLLGYRLSPQGWATRGVDLYDEHSADRIIAERNNGGEMVEATIRQVRPNAPVKTIVASRGKTVRAEPVAALYEQGRVHHVGIFPAGEEQMCAFPIENEHDDLVDALVYAISDLAQPQRTWSAA